jgi:uncharacterized protein with von Willebrand factor type A (vWA) domain
MNKLNNEIQNFIVNSNVMDEESRKKMSNILFNHFYNIDYDGVNDLSSLGDKHSNYIDSVKKLLGDKILKYLTVNNKMLSEKVSLDILKWLESKHLQLQQNNEIRSHRDNFNRFISNNQNYKKTDWYDSLKELKKTYPEFKKYWDFYDKKLRELYKEIAIELEKNGKTKRYYKLLKKLKVVKEKIIEDYGEAHNKKIDEIISNFMENETEKYVEYLVEYLEKLKSFYDTLFTFFGYLGRLWDLSEGAWQEVDWDEFEKYSKLLEQNKDIQELAEMIGRLKESEEEYEKELIEKTVITHEWKVDYAGKSEITSIHFSDDLNSLIPSEVALLSTPQTEQIFAKKFVEKKLLTYQYMDKYRLDIEKKELGEHNKKKEDKKGPVIACIDTSGSMHGTPEKVAKTIIFALLKIALKEDRRCYVISFSTNIEVMEITNINHSLEKLIKFLKMSFYGGTDATPALSKALQMLETENYKNADVVMVSDFIMPSLPTDLKNRISTQKEKNKTKFYSIAITTQTNTHFLDIFDVCWTLDYTNKDYMNYLVKCIRKVGKL